MFLMDGLFFFCLSFFLKKTAPFSFYKSTLDKDGTPAHNIDGREKGSTPMKNKIGTVVFAVLIALTLLFIFSQSLPGQSTSQAESSRVTELIRPLLAPILGAENVTVGLIRKLAHFAEFSLLGAELAGYLWFLCRKKAQSFIHGFFFVTGAALTDETIQIFTGRGPMVQDVWLDMAGGAFGILFLTFVRFLVFLIRKRRKKAAGKSA